MTNDMVARLAVQWLLCHGERSYERLADLIEHYAGVYAIPAEERPAMLKAAWEGIPAWQKGARS